MKLTPDEAKKMDEKLGEEITFFILDTVCEECGQWYGTIEYHPTSTCPKCGHIQENEDE